MKVTVLLLLVAPLTGPVICGFTSAGVVYVVSTYGQPPLTREYILAYTVRPLSGTVIWHDRFVPE